jgi:metal-responsive CopG/Arc/MetJ family transcriptional regulator
MKTAISLPDPLYAEAERLARRLKKSRSQLYAEAVAAYLRRHDVEALTEAFDRVCATIDSRADPMVEAAATRALARSEW